MIRAARQADKTAAALFVIPLVVGFIDLLISRLFGRSQKQAYEKRLSAWAEFSTLRLFSSERIAAPDLPEFQSSQKPTRTLGRAAMCKSVRYDITLSLTSQPILTDCRRTGFNEVPFGLCAVSPNPGQTGCKCSGR
jgi:hypothetical protein